MSNNKSFMNKKQKTNTNQSKKKDRQLSRPTNVTNKIDIDTLYHLIDLYFKQKNVMYTHQYNSFDKSLDEDIPNFLKKPHNNIFYEKVTKDTVYRYYFKHENIAIRPPYIEMDDEIMLPQTARLRNLTYGSKIISNITQIQEITNIATGEVTTNVVGKMEKEYPITTYPIMVRSKYCSLSLKQNIPNTECIYDPGAYFIVKGSEKVVIPLEKMIDNRPLVFIKKDSSSLIYTVQVNSKSHILDDMQAVKIRIKKDGTLQIMAPILNEIPVFILMRALGIESDNDIINYCVYDHNDKDMINVIRLSLENSLPEKSTTKIMTQNDAIMYLSNKIRVAKKYNEVDKDVKQREKVLHLKQLLTEKFLPHIEGGWKVKAYYIGYMINRLLQCYLGRVEPDDRDSFINKRVDLPGQLMFDLFKQYYRKMLNDCKKYFSKRNPDDVSPLNIITQIKPNIIEQGLNTALLTGTWGKKKGVAQMLQRLSYSQMLSSLRRVKSPTNDASTNKMTKPRMLDPSTIGDFCFIETSEGANVGLVRNLSLIGNVTVMKASHIYILKNILNGKYKKIEDVNPKEFGQYTRILLNGEVIGLTKEPRKLYTELKKMKYNGSIDPCVGIAHDLRNEFECRDLRINCDSGRMYHPVLRVEDNKILLNYDMLNNISLDDRNKTTHITSWNEFLIKNPGVIEYIDNDEKYNSMLSMYFEDVENMRQRMDEKSKDIVKKLTENEMKIITNRYDDTMFVRYTHCEIHPSLLIGTVVSGIPFCESNQGPRNIYQYSQARQAMGPYASNLSVRTDISYVLYNPQRPIVSTRNTKYIGSEQLPAGENAIVAIACFTGYNQEDSNVMNKTSIDRGFMRAMSVKKYMSIIQKNQSTSQDDMFQKPDRSMVAGMRSGTYDKLNEKGYAPEETVLYNDDIFIGKVSPIQPKDDSGKMLRDNSEHYKAHIPAVVDKVYHDIINQDGYGMIKVRLRCERIPMMGDKFCSKSGQKGTNGLQLRASDMIYTENGIMPDLIINPNCIPSRMTIGQLLECLVGKRSALKGQETDGTPFSTYDIGQIENDLKEYGYNEHGYETMYNGQSGHKLKLKIFIGPTYYQRLKHMVADKLHARARGPTTLITRLPTEGRSRDGGLRFGEMERDAMIGHGMAKFLKERLLEAADVYHCHVCNICGLFAQRFLRQDNKPYPTHDDLYFCKACKNTTDISMIRVPYCFKLFAQELMSMCIAPRIYVKNN